MPKIIMVGFIAKALGFVFALSLLMWWGSSEAFAATYNINISPDGTFDPDARTINTGDTVTWTNTGTAGDDNAIAGDQHTQHLGYPDPQCDPNDDSNTVGCWDSKPGTMDGGEIFSFTFMIGGTWGFHNHTNKPGKNTGTLTVTDLNAPAQTTDLAAASPSENSVDLTWTSPGDDAGNTGNFGTPASYDVRHSLSTITESNWGSATPVTGPSPQAAGSSQSMTVTGLDPETTYYFALKTLDDASNESVLSNIDSSTTLAAGSPPPSDTTAPSNITDLALSNQTNASIDLSWTAPGDDGSIGTATTYDIRYSTADINDGNWGSASPVTGSSPQAGGSSESMTVTGLDPTTTYYFAIKTSDEVPNESGLSNVPSLATTSGASGGGGGGITAFQDTTAPGVIADFAVEDLGATSVKLTWTAPGGDGNAGIISSYDIRYNTKKITADTWPSSTRVTGVPAPKVIGSKESITVSGLASGITYYFALSSKDEAGNEAKFSNVVSATIIDATAPSAIIDLLFTKPSLSAVILNWTAPGDDKNTGIAKSYDIRHATTSLSEENWDSAIQFLDMPSPREAGSKEYVTIPGLLHEATYYIAIKTLDEALNESEISNIITFTTVPVSPPEEAEAIPVFPQTTKGDLTVAADQGGNITATTYEGAAVRVDVAPAAISQDTTFKIFPIVKTSFDVASPLAAIPTGKQIAGDYIFEFSATTSDAIVTTFPRNITITFTYTTAQIAGLDSSTLEIRYYDKIAGVWIPFISTLDIKTNTITALSDRTARFALIGRTDITPPPAPTLIRTKALGEGRIQITWTNPTEDFSRAKIYRSEMLGELGEIRASRILASEFLDTGVVDGRTYFYTVRSVDAAGNESENIGQAGAYAIGTSQDFRDVARDLKGGDLIRGPDGIKVYIISEKGYKRHIFNPAVFDIYEHFKWEDIKDVSQEILDYFITSDLYRADGDPRVYFLEEIDEVNGIAVKHHIEMTPEQFTLSAYDWNQVFVINSQERDYYTTGTPIN